MVYQVRNEPVEDFLALLKECNNLANFLEKQFISEVALLFHLRHPNIITVHKDAKQPFLMSDCKVVDGSGTMLNPSHNSHSRLPTLPPKPVSYNYDRNPAINLTLNKATNLKQKERELQANEAEIKRREELEFFWM